MKTLIVITSLILSSLMTQAETIQSSDATIQASDIEVVIPLVNKNSPGSSLKKLNLVVSDNGMSTDLSPRYSIYLGYASLAEMGNITANFKITESPIEFLSTTRKSPGHYQIKTREYSAGDEGNGGIFEVVYDVDATKMFADEKKLREKCGGDFCDKTLKTSISVTRTYKTKN